MDTLNVGIFGDDVILRDTDSEGLDPWTCTVSLHHSLTHSQTWIHCQIGERQQ